MADLPVACTFSRSRWRGGLMSRFVVPPGSKEYRQRQCLQLLRTFVGSQRPCCGEFAWSPHGSVDRLPQLRKRSCSHRPATDRDDISRVHQWPLTWDLVLRTAQNARREAHVLVANAADNTREPSQQFGHLGQPAASSSQSVERPPVIARHLPIFRRTRTM